MRIAQVQRGITRWVDVPDPASQTLERPEPPTLRSEMGRVLRNHRQRQGMNLRQVAGKALVSWGYLSEIERGKKEASSEVLGHLCCALEITMPALLREVADSLDMALFQIPESPAALLQLCGDERIAPCPNN